MTRVIRPGAAGPFVILCDHASNQVPPELGNLGLPEAELLRHIAWDPGAAGIAEYLSEYFDSPAILCPTSRLVIDCNRQLNAPDLIPEQSDGTVIPGNLGLSPEQRQQRIERWFEPYHQAVEAVLDDRNQRGLPSTTLSVHSMTPSLAGVSRPWEIALSSYRDRSLAEPVLAALRAPGDLCIGDNQPYDLDPAVDFSTPFHALRRNLPHLQVEFRQDTVAEEAGQQEAARRFAKALTEALRPLGYFFRLE